MNTNNQSFSVTEPGSRGRVHRGGISFGLLALYLLLAAHPAEASMFQGEALDKAANALAWVVLIVVPIVGIVAFWLVHILPEKIAEKKKHPQAKAIQTLCLLSLVFGGMLWPLAWLWAYTKPVLYKMAYGTDTVEHDHGPEPASAAPAVDTVELQLLRARVKELETKLAGKQAQQGGMI
jgi:CBS domain containing-hemolysin-like protein